ncbi:MAG: aldehyde dehydrogenase [Oscillospiraceae bacterium]
MNFENIVTAQRDFWNTNATKDISFRIAQLKRLRAVITENESKIYAALRADLNKSEYEAYMTEVSLVTGEIDTAIKHLKKWSKPCRKKTPLSGFPSSSYTVKEPYGVVLVLSPWNYPFQLALSPVVGAIAAGNCVILKCSKHSSHTTAVISEMLGKSFDPKFLYCAEMSLSYDDILGQKYDYIFFTGSERVGKIVMKAASEHVTPLSLELGGKSPCFVDKSANLELSAKRIAWGKLLNAGQTCVAPDYILVDSAVKDSFTKELQAQLAAIHPNPLENPDYPAIISDDHFKRLCGLIEREPDKTGGDSRAETRKIAPAVFYNATFDSEIMQSEIFGPILPIIAYDSLDDAIRTVKSRAKPLACYIFSTDRAFSDRLVHEVSFGGGCINDAVMHLSNDNLPFGGVGSSGMGNYHGAYSFDTFSHEKSIFKSKNFLDIPLRYAPYKPKNLKLMRKIVG